MVPAGSISQLSQIKWAKADIFNPATYAEELDGATAVVHSVGMAMEFPGYKELVNGDVSGLLDTLCKTVKGRNPMTKRPGDEAGMEKMNYESAKILADAFAATNKQAGERKPFVYISADDQHALSKLYIESKRRAEKYITGVEGLRGVFLRPGFMTDGNAQKWSLREGVGMVMKKAGGPIVLDVKDVAAAAIEAVEEGNIEGVIGLDTLKIHSQIK